MDAIKQARQRRRDMAEDEEMYQGSKRTMGTIVQAQPGYKLLHHYNYDKEGVFQYPIVAWEFGEPYVGCLFRTNNAIVVDNGSMRWYSLGDYHSAIQLPDGTVSASDTSAFTNIAGWLEWIHKQDQLRAAAKTAV